MTKLRTIRIAFLASGLAATTSCAANDVQAVTIHAQVWADNWFALYEGNNLIIEDSVPYQTERSFNAENFEFAATLPVNLSVIIKDFKENDSGLEYIGSRRQQIGDGGFIAQFFDSDEKLLAVTDDSWRCIAIHQAPLNKRCSRDENPLATCQSRITAPPDNWRNADFDDSEWPPAVVHSTNAVRPHGEYNRVDWQPSARLVWTADLEIDNTVLCRFTLADIKEASKRDD